MGHVTPFDVVMKNWQRSREALSEERRSIAIAEITLPARMVSFCHREGCITVGELLDVPEHVLRRACNLGTVSLDQTLTAIVRITSRAAVPH